MITFFLVLFTLYLVLTVLIAVFQEKLIFHPVRLADDHVFHFQSEAAFRQYHPDLHIEELSFRESPDAVAHGLHFQLPDPQGVILYFHGNAGSLQDWGEVAFDFLAKGYEVVMVDYRGYGKSRGKLSQKTLLADAERFYDHVMSLYPESKIHLYGRSLGTGIAAYLASNHAPAQLVLESPYFSLKSLSAQKFPWLPVRFLHRYPLLTHQYLSHVKCPITLFHGTLDQLIPCSHSERLLNSLPEGKAVYHEIPRKGHNDIWGSPEYHQVIERIFPASD